MITIQCKQCGSDAVTKNFNRLYCDKCKLERERIQKREWRRRKSARLSSTTSKKLKLVKECKDYKPICMHCGRVFEPSYTGEKYCSEECYVHSPLRKIYAQNPQALNFLVPLLLGES